MLVLFCSAFVACLISIIGINVIDTLISEREKRKYFEECKRFKIQFEKEIENDKQW